MAPKLISPRGQTVTRVDLAAAEPARGSTRTKHRIAIQRRPSRINRNWPTDRQYQDSLITTCKAGIAAHVSGLREPQHHCHI